MKIHPLTYVIGAWFAYRYYQSHKYNSSMPAPPTTPPPFSTTIPATHIPPAHAQW